MIDAKGIGVAQPSTYMVVRLPDISSKTGNNAAFFVLLGCF